MTEIVPKVAWEQRSDESAAEHAWFHAFLELGDKRTVAKAAKRCGVATAVLKEASIKHDWKNRAEVYDKELQKLATTMIADETEALAVQWEAGRMLLKFGITALEYRNPHLLKMKDIRDVITSGAEMVRRGAGVADLKVDHTTTKRVQDMFDVLLGDGDE